MAQLSWDFGDFAVGQEGKAGGRCSCVRPHGWILSFTCCAQTHGPPNAAPGPNLPTPVFGH